MRYRPFGRSGAAISNLTLSLGSDALRRGADHAREMVFSSLEAGINSYRLESADTVLAEVVGQALGHVDRKLIGLTITLGNGDGRKGERDFSAEGMTAAIDRALSVSRLGWIDAALLAEPGEHELPQSSLQALKALRATGRVKFLGVCGEGEVMDAYVSTGAFDILATPYHVNVPWQIRSRIRAAREQDMAIFAYDYFPESLDSERKAATVHKPKRGLFSFASRPKIKGVAGADAFAFLHRTQAWSAEEICLGYALTEPSISSVLIHPRDVAHMQALAAVPERDLPPGLAAQIEMARVAAAQAA